MISLLTGRCIAYLAWGNFLLSNKFPRSGRIARLSLHLLVFLAFAVLILHFHNDHHNNPFACSLLMMR